MSENIQELEPIPLWSCFSQLNAIPRATGKEAQAAKYILDLAQQRGLQTITDKVGNVLVRKPATEGKEHCATLALQAHLDMVHQKNTEIQFDFETEGIKMYTDGEWVKAKATTLGADNGIGVAAILAVLTSESIPHPPLEALFTVSKEKGMIGALALPNNILQASAMLNLDAEKEGTIIIGCAGCVAITAKGTYQYEPVPENAKAYTLSVSGLTGGHSGLDIHLGRANAIKVLCKLMTFVSTQCSFNLGTMRGGYSRNAIPREAEATVVVTASNVDKFMQLIDLQSKNLCQLFRTTDPGMQVKCQHCALPENIMSIDDRTSLHYLLSWCPDGVYTMSSDVPGLVQTSNNLALLTLENGQYELQCLTRSSVDTEKEQLAQSIKGACQAAGAEVLVSGSYSGWTPNPDTAIVRRVASTYNKLFHRKPKITAIHAELECGIISAKYPTIEIISLGPTILGAHTPEERVQISSVQRFWRLLLEVLANMPSKKAT